MKTPIKIALVSVVVVGVLSVPLYNLYKRVYSKSGVVQADTLLLTIECTELISRNAREEELRGFLKKVGNAKLAISVSDVVVKENSRAVDGGAENPKAMGDPLSKCVQQVQSKLDES